MSHFVQDKFQSTNSEDKYKHILYMSKNTHTRKKILNTSYKRIENIFKTLRVNKNIYSNYLFIFNFWYFFPFTHNKCNIFHFLVEL